MYAVSSPEAEGDTAFHEICIDLLLTLRQCDRKTPCNNCVRRGIPEHCHLPRFAEGHGGKSLPALAPVTAQPVSSTSLSSPQREPTPARRPALSGLLGSPRPVSDDTNSPQIGHLWNTRGAASYHGSSYFGHQAAASMMHMESPDLPTGMRGIYAANRERSVPQREYHRHEKGPYSHIWELVGYLPRRKSVVDRLVAKFLVELNPIYDSLHGETFQTSYDAFWNRKWGDDDLTAVDLRWLSLLFMTLAFAELLDCPSNAPPETQSACEEMSMQFFWAARKAIVLAPTFSGESPDLVRAGILVSQYLILFGRKTEAWLTSSFAIRMAQAQGMHIDGESWGLPRKVLEIRRRLWSKLYAQDRSISLAVGRPYTINDKHCMKMNITNVWLDETGISANSTPIQPDPLSDPTRSVYYACQQELSSILGHIHDECFGLSPISTSYSSYEKVLNIDRVLQNWADALPPYFGLTEPDRSMDQEKKFLSWQRMYLHSAYHFARITLHRTFVVIESITDRFHYSRDACISSACADLKLKLSLRNLNMGDRLNAGAAMHNLFNSGLVLGIIAVRDPFSPRTNAIVEDLAAYCEKQRADPWTNQFALAEVKIIELCISSARKAARVRLVERTEHPSMTAVAHPTWTNTDADGSGNGPDLTGTGNIAIDDTWLDNWFGPTRAFPEPNDFEFWEGLVGTLEMRQ